MPSLISTVTVQQVINYVSTHIFLKRILNVGGIAGEPGLSFANDILQYLLAKPFAYKFNRKFLPFFVTQPYIQDYSFAGAGAFTLTPVLANGTQATVGGGGVGIDLATNNAITQAGSVVTVNCLQRHNYVVGQTAFFNNIVDASGNLVAALNGVLTVDTNALQSSWTNGFVITAIPSGTSFQISLATVIPACGAPGIFDFGWLEAVALTDIANTAVPQPTGPIKAVDRITPSSLMGETAKVAALQDLGTGIMVFRTDPCGTTYSMAVSCTYQGRAPQITTTRQTFAPWPDNLAFALRSGMKAFAYDLTEKSEAEKLTAMKKFENDRQVAAGYEDAEESDEGFAPSRPLMQG